MIKFLRPALFSVMLAIVVISPASIYAAEISGANTLSVRATAGDFFSVFDWWVWAIIGVILAIIIVFILFMLFSPKKKKGEQSVKGEKQAKRGQAVMDKKLKPQVKQGQAPRPGQMAPEMAPPPVMPDQPYMSDTTAYQQDAPPQQMRPPQQAAAPSSVSPQMSQPRPMPSQSPQQPPQRMQPPPVQQPPQYQPQHGQQAPVMPQRMAPQPVQGQSQPVQQPRPMQSQPQPMQGQPRPFQPPQQAPGMAPRAVPQPMPQQPRPGMTPRPMPSAMPQPGPQQPQRFGPGVPPRMDFVVGGLSVIPMQVKEGDPVTISATVTNRGASLNKYSMVFRINHVVEHIAEMSLGPGASQTATITVNKEAPGDYYVEVDGSRGLFTVLERIPASFSISGLTVSPERVKQGQTIAIGFMVTNNGEKPGVYKAEVDIKGMSEATEDITLEPGETKHVTFNIIKDTAGFYPVSVEHMSGRFVVEMDWKG
jgi:uncharacterized cupredoxin-like copper-binding protein